MGYAIKKNNKITSEELAGKLFWALVHSSVHFLLRDRWYHWAVAYGSDCMIKIEDIDKHPHTTNEGENLTSMCACRLF